MVLARKLIFIFFFAIIFLYSINAINQADTFYDLKTGEYIVQSHTIPTRDIFSLTALGNEWIPHEWLAQVVFYLVYAASGINGLIVFVALLAVLAYYLVYKISRLARRNLNESEQADTSVSAQASAATSVLVETPACAEASAGRSADKKVLVDKPAGKPTDIAALLLFLFGYLTLGLWVPRPQIFGYLATAALLYCLEAYRHNAKTKYLFATAAIILFWANMHASFILGLVVVAFYFAAEQMKKIRPQVFGTTQLSQPEINRLGITALAGTALAFLNPAGYKAFLYSYYIRDTAQIMNVLEWRPITMFWFIPRAQVFLGIFGAMNMFLAWHLLRKNYRDLTVLGLTLGISILPFISIRHVAFWPLAATPFLIIILAPMLAKFADRLKPWLRLAIFVTIGLALLFGRYFTFPRSQTDGIFTPEEAVDFIQTNNLRGPFFNLYNEGGYLIWRLWPEDKVFIDGRSEVYHGQSLDDFFTILQGKSFDAAQGVPGWEKLMDEKYKLNYFFLTYRPDSVGTATGPLTAALLQKNFVLVYWDDMRIILARDNPENSEIIQRFGLQHINPFRDPTQIPPEERKAAAAEIQSLLEREPESQEIQNYASEFLTGK